MRHKRRVTIRESLESDHDVVVTEGSRKPSLLVQLGVGRSRDPHDNDALEQRIAGFARLWPVVVLATIIGHLPIIANSAEIGNVAALIGILILSAFPLITFSRRRGKLLRPNQQVMLLAAVSGGIGIFSGSILQSLQDHQSWSLAAFLGGTILVIVTALARLPVTLITFAAGLIVSSLLALNSIVGIAILAPLLGCLLIVALEMARSDFVAARRLTMALEDSSRPSRLLSELEQGGSVWFWETDRRGHITYVTPKIAPQVGLSASQLIGRPFTSIISENGVDDGSPMGERTLSFFLSTKTAFSELPIRANSKDERWWSITGRPIYDRFDQLRGFIGTGTDLTEIRRSEAEVSRLARFDPLTGLANRAEIGNLLRQAMTGQGGTSRAAALFLIDLDRFKNVNDTMGHPAGDALLKQVSQRLVNAIGANGHVGRLGGDEFKVVLPGNSTRNHLEALARGIIESVSRPYLIDGAQVSIGASVGIAIAPDDGKSADDLTRNADLALYAAKEAGRGVHRFYAADMHSSANRRRQLESDLTDALSRDDFRLVYQPVVSCVGERVTGFEALIRWTHPVHGPISPAEFIPIAEESSLIERIGEWVLRRACEEAAGWRVPARVAVNVSPIQFANPAFPTLVSQVLAQTGLAPQRLELEITEGVFIGENSIAERQFDTLKRIGVRLALDDFGTGYSSLGYLQRAPLNKIKIDQSFVRGATLGNNQNAAIIRSIVTLAEALGMETTAEGAETEDEIELIRKLGCSHIQGYYYGPPMEVAELTEKLGLQGAEPNKVGPKTSRAPRLSILRRGRLTINGKITPVRLRNISETGALIELAAYHQPGQVAKLEIQDGPLVDVRIVWWSDNRCGLAFAEPMALEWLAAERPARVAS